MTTFNDLVDALQTLQQFRCGICGGQPESLVVDHDHDTGFVRGLLCPQCNHEEGRHSCDLDRMGCPICRWRSQPAVSWLGATVRYESSWRTVAVWLPAYAPSRDLTNSLQAGVAATTAAIARTLDDARLHARAAS